MIGMIMKLIFSGVPYDIRKGIQDDHRFCRLSIRNSETLSKYFSNLVKSLRSQITAKGSMKNVPLSPTLARFFCLRKMSQQLNQFFRRHSDFGVRFENIITMIKILLAEKAKCFLHRNIQQLFILNSLHFGPRYGPTS